MDATDQVLNNLTLESKKDRISELPESILTNILSRLPTKEEAVATSVLSRTWEMKWTCILSLDFNDTLLYSRRVTNRQRFAAFVQEVLHHRGDSRIESFTLVCSQNYGLLVTQWISIALRQGVKRLIVRCRSGGGLFPNSFLGCEPLEEARITIPRILNVSPVTAFLNLKVLFISSMQLRNENYPYSIELFFTFPTLETFSMFCCSWVNVKVIKIEAPCLSSFGTSGCKYVNGRDHRLYKCEIYVLGARDLTEVKWASDDFLESFILPSTPSKAILDHFLRIDYFRIAGIGAVKFLELFSSLIHLELTIDLAEAMDVSGAIVHLPMLNQVLYLKLDTNYSGSTRALMYLLRKTPNLRCLEIKTSLAWKENDCELLGTLPLSVMWRLERVYFTFLHETSIGLYLMKLLLKNAHVLQLMHVRVLKVPKVIKTQLRLLLLVAFRASAIAFVEVE